MAASLTTAERRILEAAEAAGSGGRVEPPDLTAAVRRRVGQITGYEFRQSVARLNERHLLQAQVSTKPGGEVGRVVIERITPLGLGVIGRARSGNTRPWP